MIKNIQQTKYINYLSIIKVTYKNPIVNIILNGKRLERFSSRIKSYKRMPVFNISIQYSTGRLNQSKQVKEK